MHLAHKIRLKPNKVQATYFARAVGTACFAYNWALVDWGRQYQACKLDHTRAKPSHLSLRRALNAIKKQEFPWMMQVTKSAPQIAIMQLGTAFQNFFALRARYPKFRKKGLHDRFSITNEKFSENAMRISLPRLGWVRICEALHCAGKIMLATVSRVAKKWADKWSASMSVELPAYTLKTKAENQGEVGVDWGVAALTTLSSGEKIPGPKALKASLRKLQRVSRGLSRKVPGSRNRAQARLKVARLHARISAIRQDGLHQLTTSLTRRFPTIGMEDPNVQAMVKKTW